MKNNELAKLGGVYVPPSTEAITLVTECRLLDGSPQGNLQNMEVNAIISESF